MKLPDSPAVAHRHSRQHHERHLPGVILSFTTITHPPKGFPQASRIIGLIELQNGKHVLAPLIATNDRQPMIGMNVLPRLQLSRINEQGLRLYDTAYEVTVQVSKHAKIQAFPGYILALSGPSGVGKKTVRNLLTHVLIDFTEKVPVVTTRLARGTDDDREYEFVSLKEFERLQRSGDIIAWTRVAAFETPRRAPSNDQHFFGYRSSAISAIWNKGKIPVVVTEMRLLEGLARSFGRRSILSCGLLPPGRSKRMMLSSLLHRLRSRGRDSEEQMKSLLENARTDIKFLNDSRHLFDHILVNEDLDVVIQTLKGHVLALNETVSE
ncbi:MAG: OB-fold domain-containing protein [Candidatus Peregrinibacteria bacterium]